jgi:hypothetical protein
MLASQMPNSLILDIEHGAYHTGRPRVTWPREGSSYDPILSTVKEIARLQPNADGLLEWKPRGSGETYYIGTLVIDTLDELQAIAGADLSKSNMQSYWRQLLEKMKEVCDYTKRCACHTVFVCHSQERKEQTDQERRQRKPIIPVHGMMLGGSIRNRLPAWVDVSLHLLVEPDGKKKLITQQTLINGASYYAKDRAFLFKGREFYLEFDRDGVIRGNILDHILAVCTGGRVQDHEALALADAKEALLQAAIDKGIMKSLRDSAGVQVFKDYLATCNLLPDDALARKEECLAAVAAWSKE